MVEISKIHQEITHKFLNNHPRLKANYHEPLFREKRWTPMLMCEIIEAESILTRDDKPLQFVVRYNATSGEILSWVLRKDLAANLVVIDRDYARSKALEEVRDYLHTSDTQKQDITAPYAGPSVELVEPVAGERVFSVSWRHLVDNILVEDDFLAVEVDPKEGEVISIINQWHKITKRPMAVSAASAYKNATQALKDKGFRPPPKSAAFASQRYVCRPVKPYESPEYKPAWHFRIPDNSHASSGHFWDVYVDDAGEILKLTNSR